MVKYLRTIEFIHELQQVGVGYGGYREDYQYYDRVPLYEQFKMSEFAQAAQTVSTQGNVPPHAPLLLY